MYNGKGIQLRGRNNNGNAKVHLCSSSDSEGEETARVLQKMPSVESFFKRLGDIKSQIDVI